MTPIAQLSALERLLDDPSPVVRKAVIEGVKSAGTDGVLWLEKLSTDKILGTFAQSLLGDLRTSESATHSFLNYINAGKMDLEEACLLLERVIHPSLRVNAYAAELDRLTARTRELIAEPLDTKEKCRLLCRVIFGEEGYRGAERSFAAPDSSLLSRVISTKRGIPISLCIIFLLVARRLNLPVEPVGLPGRFMVGVFTGRAPFYIDCYQGGTFRTRAEVQLLLLDNHLPADENFLQPVTVMQTIARCCRNLVSQLEAHGNDHGSRQFVGFVHALEKIDYRV
jgi:regulator of sirC expression with transglutaminase-like and TPR domain